MKSKGLSVIEFVIVLLIIFILAAICLPRFMSKASGTKSEQDNSGKPGEHGENGKFLQDDGVYQVVGMEERVDSAAPGGEQKKVWIMKGQSHGNASASIAEMTSPPDPKAVAYRGHSIAGGLIFSPIYPAFPGEVEKK